MAVPGPPALGRGVVILDGQDVPSPWRAAKVLVVGQEALDPRSGVVDTLHRAWACRVPVAVALAFDPAGIRQAPGRPAEPWTLGARFEFIEDRLQFLLWANNYDARSGRAIWWWSRKASRLGARVVDDSSVAPDRTDGDVVGPDGTPAWIDGGPRGPLADSSLWGIGYIHRETVERGSLNLAPPPRPSSAELAPDQMAAVAHLAGPARIIAPAGSGKTRVLTERLRHLVVDQQWERSVTLAVAYNKKAQEELDARCRDFSPRTRTLNSLGYAIVSDARGAAPRVLEERETRRLVERLAPVRRHRANTDPIGPYLEALGQVRLGLVDPAVVEEERDDVAGLADLFPRYRAELAAERVVDFDDQVYGAIEALVADGELRSRHQAACRHLLVDEFQDLTPAHVLLLRLLASPGLDVFGVGDDDQVIYGHAGADPGFLIAFDQLFPGAGAHPLEVNYRCPADVVDAAATLLSYNRRRVQKTIRPARLAAETGPRLSVRRNVGAAAIDALVARVGEWCHEAHGPSGVAVLSRVNSLLLAPQVALVSAGIPVASVLRPEVLERTGLRAALAYLRIATADEGDIDPKDVTEVLRRPSRGLPQWFPDRLRRRTRWSIRALGDIATTMPAKDSAKVTSLIDDLMALRALAAGHQASTVTMLRAVRDDIGLGGAMGLLDASRGGEGSSHLDDLEALEQVAALHPDAASFEPWLRSVVSRQAEAGGVTLSTVHRVKGMEWDRVAVWGVNAGILPHRLADDIEEERRVLHVAVTRCRQEVIVMADRTRPSPFLEELDGSAAHVDPGVTAATRTPPLASRPGAPASGAARKPLADRGTLPLRQQGVEEALRAWRLERARADGVPPFVVMSDRTLREIVTCGPASLVALRQISGIGPAKLDRYGDDILEVLAEAAEATSLAAAAASPELSERR